MRTIAALALFLCAPAAFARIDETIKEFTARAEKAGWRRGASEEIVPKVTQTIFTKDKLKVEVQSVDGVVSCEFYSGLTKQQAEHLLEVNGGKWEPAASTSAAVKFVWKNERGLVAMFSELVFSISNGVAEKLRVEEGKKDAAKELEGL